MVFNAKARYNSTGYDTVAAPQSLELLHQRLDVTNNDNNTWSTHRSVVYHPSNEHLNRPAGNFNGEGITTPSLDSEFYQYLASAKSPTYTNNRRSESTRQKTNSQQDYQKQITNMNSFAKPGLMLGTNDTQWSLSYRRGSFEEISSMRDRLKDFQQESCIDSVDEITIAVSSSPSLQLSYPADTTSHHNLYREKYIPAIDYSSFSPETHLEQQVFQSIGTGSTNGCSSKATWFPQPPQSYDSQMSAGLPRTQDVHFQPQYCSIWKSESGISWTDRASIPDAISPEALTLNTPTFSLPTSSSYQSSSIESPETSTLSSFGNDHFNSPGPEEFNFIEYSPAVHRHDKDLSNIKFVSDMIVPLLSSHHACSSKARKSKRLSGNVSPAASAQKDSSCFPLSSAYKTHFVRNPEACCTESSPSKRIEPRPTRSQRTPRQSKLSRSSLPSPVVSVTTKAQHEINSRNEFLVNSKLAGMSYKDIRREGNFIEAESTLRGRYRTLTKQKSARVRKPGWSDNDIRLLEEGVCKLTHGADTIKGKIPWKKIAEHIANNGGSYHFGNATCRKRWDELQAQSQEDSSRWA